MLIDLEKLDQDVLYRTILSGGIGALATALVVAGGFLVRRNWQGPALLTGLVTSVAAYIIDAKTE